MKHHTYTYTHEMPPNISKKWWNISVRCGVNSMKFHRRLFQAPIIMPPLYRCVHAALCSCRNKTFLWIKKNNNSTHRMYRLIIMYTSNLLVGNEWQNSNTNGNSNPHIHTLTRILSISNSMCYTIKLFNRG